MCSQILLFNVYYQSNHFTVCNSTKCLSANNGVMGERRREKREMERRAKRWERKWKVSVSTLFHRCCSRSQCNYTASPRISCQLLQPLAVQLQTRMPMCLTLFLCASSPPSRFSVCLVVRLQYMLSSKEMHGNVYF